MKDFDYLTPSTLDEALRWLADTPGRVRPIAGGTDLLIRMKEGQWQPAAVMDLTHLGDLRQIREAGEMIEIGAGVRHAEAAAFPLLKARAPLLAEACAAIGSWQIRNMGTLAGNLCNASPAADTFPPLVALKAEVEIASVRGRRIIPLEKFALGPGKTSLEADELLIWIRFPLLPSTAFSFFKRVGQRKALAIAKASLAFVGIPEEGVERWKEVRIALGAVAPTVIRAPQTESYLMGKLFSRAVLREAATFLEEEAKPISDIRSTVDYRRRVTGNMLIEGLWSLMKED